MLLVFLLGIVLLELKIVDVRHDHFGQQWWLRAVKVINPTTIGNEAIVLDIIEQVLDDIESCLRHVTNEQAAYDPPTIPIIRLSKPIPFFVPRECVRGKFAFKYT